MVRNISIEIAVLYYDIHIKHCHFYSLDPYVNKRLLIRFKHNTKYAHAHSFSVTLFLWETKIQIKYHADFFQNHLQIIWSDPIFARYLLSPVPFCCCRTNHKSIFWIKLYQTGMSSSESTLSIYISIFRSFHFVVMELFILACTMPNELNSFSLFFLFLQRTFIAHNGSGRIHINIQKKW